MKYYNYLSVILILIYIFECNYSLNVEELKPLNYEVDILQTPIKRGEEPSVPVVHMTSMYGQEYSCTLPQVEEEDSSEKIPVDEKSTDIKELLKPMKTGSCLLKGKDWWTYEFCFGHYIKQFHIEDGQIIGQVITLGLYDSDYDWSNDTDEDKFKHVKQRYHSQYYVNGTKCDLTGHPRSAEVRLYCEEDAGDYIYRVDEPGTCNYVITVHTSRLCSHPQLKPLPAKKAYSIPCHPLLNEEQYSSYMKKLNEEKELADRKRSQWLNSQQERLQEMKNENMHNIESIEKQKMSLKSEAEKEKNPIHDKSETDKSDESSSSEEKKSSSGKSNEAIVESYLFQEYDRELEKLKSILPPEKFSILKKSIQKHFDAILDEAEEDESSELSEEAKDLSYQKLTNTLNMLLKKLDKAEKDVVEATKELNKVKSVITETSEEDTDEKSKDSKGEKNEKKDSSVDEGRRIEVKIITAGYYDNEEGKDFHTLSDEETNQFQNMIMALLTGQQEAVQEMERQKKLETNYRFTWNDDKEEEKDG
ncbi:protein OS-9-like isoform X2 [Argiope bruennichi]|uniref:protein OS-9-like isoform X2 n=1 Tax=Argiope bruennichi TaxID=94029 RepID=UPI0024946467|nr:protein OS-9-like isoform X2 [Argiope bruennichi]